MKSPGEFLSPYAHGFVRASVCVPLLRVADVSYNAERTIELARRCAANGSAVALFPELGLSAYSNEDLFHQDALLRASLSALESVVRASESIGCVIVVGVPLVIDQKLFNCGVALLEGRVLGVTPKFYLPNYREFYEKRQFTSGREAVSREVEICGDRVPFGSDVIFHCANLPHFAFHMEICEDLWTPIPPSTHAALAGATLLLNLSASNITIGKAEYRRELASSHSGRCLAAYLYAAAGSGESSTDLAWDGEALIYENGRLLAESPRFSMDERLVTSDLDLTSLIQDRIRMTSFNDSASAAAEHVRAMRHVEFELTIPALNEPSTRELKRTVARFPYVPGDPAKRDERSYEAYNIQVHALAKRLQHTGIENLVIGVSGGLDSTHALIVCARTMDLLGKPRTNIHACTMPGFATSKSTKSNATALMQAIGVTAREIDIRPSCMQMFKDLRHPFADGKPVYDVTFENVQAGERTSHLFRLANFHNGLVVGTGDLSELALGWSTYGVGDHMSHYNVNASVPKTLIQYLIRWIIATRQVDEETCRVLQAIVDTEISPELVPAAAVGEDKRKGEPSASDLPSQITEEKIGPYELQDFNLYYITRFGMPPSKVAYLSYMAWKDRRSGNWPDELPEEKRHEYSLDEIKRWLGVFVYRFFQISQFKRSCVPNSPKVGSGGSLSPRGDWRAPSDAEARIWIEELETNVPDGL
ncbi:MAG TPA: NAD(+) synthase [Spirochaetia bacterium]|nr:NAD(+) synthase [Spirochaetia bacterium]